MNTTNKKITITQVRSGIGQMKRQKRTLKALGISKRGRSVLHNDTPGVRGMVESIKHLVAVSEVRGE